MIWRSIQLRIHTLGPRAFKALLLITLAAMLAGCPHHNSGFPPPLQHPALQSRTPVSGVDHIVGKDETLTEIAKTYNVDVQQLAEVNNLDPPYLIKENGRIFIPGVSQLKKVDRKQKSEKEAGHVEDFPGLLTWPVEGTVVSQFGVRKGVQYNGISIQAPKGSPVRAAGEGRVGYVGSIPSFGKVVLIEHANRLVTVYAHLEKIGTKNGTTVKTGHIIGTVGSSGRVDTPSLYFEVRSRSKPRNPLFFLSRRP